ncbi:MAG: hypothetical protein NC489_29010 [Ruminococcus flavefaciens]|nr:hypothetical protein [Ruminococcus flavefaciens]
MKLIDTDLLIQDLHNGIFDDCDCKKDYEYLGIDNYINNQPIAFDLKKCNYKSRENIDMPISV